MIGLAELRRLNSAAEQKARRLGNKPHVIFRASDLDKMPPFPFPFIGHRNPKGWKRIDRLFVDSTGPGSDSESAFTPKQLVVKLRELEDWAEQHGNILGYGIVERGQFQLTLGVYLQVG
jgi:hypothetical protein